MPTTASRPRRLLLCLLVVATLATAAYATTASAAATPVPIYTQTTVVGPAPDPQPCTGVLGGTFTLTVTEQGHMVTNADGTFHEFLTVTFNLREDWTDGSYLIDQAVGPMNFNMNGSMPGRAPASSADRRDTANVIERRGTMTNETAEPSTR